MSILLETNLEWDFKQMDSREDHHHRAMGRMEAMKEVSEDKVVVQAASEHTVDLVVVTMDIVDIMVHWAAAEYFRDG